ncbi:MAG: signal peptidase I [Blastochloris sp.]|nr:signal peptidase I [Blastochloris sp.]
MNFHKEIKEHLHFMRRKWNYSRDLFTPGQTEEFRSLEAELKSLQIERGQSEGEKKRLENATRRLEKLFPSHSNYAGWAENVEVIFVAIVLALAIRTYFFQPFKIPTDSMKPTLWGIALQAHPEPLPHFGKRLFDLAVYGKTYHELLVKESGRIRSITEGPYLGLIPMIRETKVEIGSRTYSLGLSRAELSKAGLGAGDIGKQVEKGQLLLRFERLTGDQVFVNRFIYHFRQPRQGEVFVFTTHDIPGILSGYNYSSEQYYIKRCVGVPGATLELAPPYLLSNGEVFGLKRPEFERIYSQENGYTGYVFGPKHLDQPGAQVLLKKDQFWAMGDNSPQSSDSRFWGHVPRKNLIGTGAVVYWPFGPRWGAIH